MQQRCPLKTLRPVISGFTWIPSPWARVVGPRSCSACAALARATKSAPGSASGTWPFFSRTCTWPQLFSLPPSTPLLHLRATLHLRVAHVLRVCRNFATSVAFGLCAFLNAPLFWFLFAGARFLFPPAFPVCRFSFWCVTHLQPGNPISFQAIGSWPGGFCCRFVSHERPFVRASRGARQGKDVSGVSSRAGPPRRTHIARRRTHTFLVTHGRVRA